MHLRTLASIAALGMAMITPAFAQSRIGAATDEVIETYSAYIGEDDLYNSSGQRLTKPWQIIRQDRANLHRYGIADDGDEWDTYFADEINRAVLESLLASGDISSRAARSIVRGDVFITVQIVAGRRGNDYVIVDVE